MTLHNVMIIGVMFQTFHILIKDNRDEVKKVEGCNCEKGYLVKPVVQWYHV